MARELDDAVLMLRTNELEIGTWIFNTRGDTDKVLAADATLKANENDWFVRQVIGFLRRTLARLDVSSRTLFAIIDKGSCFAGTCSSSRWPPTAATCSSWQTMKPVLRRSRCRR